MAEQQQSKASRIRQLASEKMSVSAIAEQIVKEYGGKCRYQQVYNVISYSKGLASAEEVEKAKGARIDRRKPRTNGEITEVGENELEEEEEEEDEHVY